MADDKMLSQEEIDALLKQSNNEEPPADIEPGAEQAEQAGGAVERVRDELPEVENGYLTPEEKDALGEVGNISMGSASTTLSELLQQRVTITSPKVHVTKQDDLFKSFTVPYMVIHVQFKEGFTGFNILVMQLHDAMVMANLMMGGDGTQISEEISDMEISAASEAMNQMIGTASTSLATMFNRSVNITPPDVKVLRSPEEGGFQLPMEDPVVVVSFRMTIGELLDTEIMQILNLDTAKEVASLLWQGVKNTKEPAAEQEASAGQTELSDIDDIISGGGPEPDQYRTQLDGKQLAELDIDQERLAMLMDIPLRATVVLGRAKKPIKEVLGYTPGTILELAAQVDDPVEILVNGVLVARGEVVAVNENFGVRITDIITPAERVQKLIE